jgi:hypothetical protein
MKMMRNLTRRGDSESARKRWHLSYLFLVQRQRWTTLAQYFSICRRTVVLSYRHRSRKDKAGIAVLTINTPALRSRPSDIPILIQYFLDQAQKKVPRSQKHKIEDHAISMLSTYGWPGPLTEYKRTISLYPNFALAPSGLCWTFTVRERLIKQSRPAERPAN